MGDCLQCGKVDSTQPFVFCCKECNTSNMEKYRRCVCCKTNFVGSSGVMCENCWIWTTTKMGMGDLAIVVAGIAHREPDNKVAVNIRNYIIADNYTYGNSDLKKETQTLITALKLYDIINNKIKEIKLQKDNYFNDTPKDWWYKFLESMVNEAHE